MTYVHPSGSVARPGTRAIGVLGNAFGDPYSIPIAQSAAQKLAQEGFHTICFTGGFPGAPIYRGADGSVAVPEVLDAMVLLSATLRGFDDELKRMLATTHAPVVSIGATLPNASSVTADDETGVFQAVAHLVKRHDCKRIAFIAGPEGSFDGARRLNAYRIALESFKLAWDPTLAMRGDYEARSGREAVIALRRPGSRSFDAIVAANDLMAIGAIEGLRAAGLRVPDDVKVVGFDDMEEATFVSPSLTTVRQPILEQGLAAAEILMRQLRGAPEVTASVGIVEQPTQISTPLVIRHSCGCGAADSARRGPALSSEAAEDRDRVDDALRGVIRKQFAVRRVHRELARVADNMLGAPGFPELAPAVTEVFRLLGARRFLLCVYAGNQRHARVVLESSGREVVFRGESQAFPVGHLVPSGFLKPNRPTQLWIEPLYIADEHLGYFILEADAPDGHTHFELRHYLSAALGRITLTRELRRVYAAERKAADSNERRPPDPGRTAVLTPAPLATPPRPNPSSIPPRRER